jgi:hypothetical protein
MGTKDRVIAALVAHGSVSDAALAIGMPRSTFYLWMRRIGIRAPRRAVHDVHDVHDVQAAADVHDVHESDEPPKDPLPRDREQTILPGMDAAERLLAQRKGVGKLPPLKMRPEARLRFLRAADAIRAALDDPRHPFTETDLYDLIADSALPDLVEEVKKNPPKGGGNA